MPLPLGLLLLALGWWCGRTPRRARCGRRLLSAGLLLLLLFGNKAVSTRLVSPLESRYPAIPELPEGEPPPPALAACRWVVVLGGGHGDTPGLSALDKLSPSALARISEAARLLRVLPGARLIVSGPASDGEPSHAEILSRAAVSLGVAAYRIRLVDTARDTDDESRAVKSIVGDDPVALVTSAWHMPRAAALFREAGVHALPCPTDFSARPNVHFHLSDLGWDVESLERSTWAVHEDLGLLWTRMQTKSR